MADRKAFSGSLLHVSLADVFQLLGGNSFTGILNLRSQYSDHMGVIYFINGNPVNGYYGDLKGLDAVYAMFGWSDGNYEFYEQALTQIETVITKNRMHLVLDALRMLDDGEIKKVGPLPPDQTEINEKGKEGEPFQTNNGPLKLFCSNCKTPLSATGTKVIIGGQDYCFNCAMSQGNSKNGTIKVDDKPLDKIKSRFKSWGPFQYAVIISLVLVWVIVGVMLYQKFNPSLPKPEVATSGQAVTGQMAVTQTMPVANNAGTLNAQVVASGQVKTAPVIENQPVPKANNASSLTAQNLASGQIATPPKATDKKTTPAPVDKVAEPAKQVVVPPVNPGENNTGSKATVEEVEKPQVTVAKEEVKETLDSAKSNEAAEKLEVAKLTPPAEAAAVKEQAAKLSTVIKEPEFPGGKAALAKWIGSNLKYPDAANKAGVQGNVIVELTIDPPNGKISNVTIVKSLQKQCDQEVLRLISIMPNWTPGEINGVKTISRHTLSVRFALSN
jgi:TonB family protein